MSLFPFCILPVRRHRTCNPFAGLLLIILILLVSRAALAEDEVKLTPQQAQNLGIRLAHPVSSRTDQTIPYPAQIVIPTPQLWVVSAPLTGMVTNLAVARGDRVEAGQPLLTLESQSFVSLQREYLQAVAQELLARQQLKRNSDLFEGKAVPQRVLETSQAEARQATLALSERRRLLQLIGLDDAAIEHLTNDAAINAALVVRAPRSASVVDIAVSPGQRLDQAAPLVKLARLSPLWAEIAIPSSSIRAIRTGARVDIEGYPQPGRVILISETTDAATQTILVRAEIPNTGDLHPGQTAAVRINYLSDGDSAWEIPYSGLVRRGEQSWIFIAIPGGFRLQPVKLLTEDQNHVVVAGPVSEKDEVAVGGVSALRGILARLGAGQ